MTLPLFLSLHTADPTTHPCSIDTAGENSLKIDPAIGWDAEWTLGKAYNHAGRYEDGLKMSRTALDGSKGRAPEIALLVGGEFDGGGEVCRRRSDTAWIREGARRSPRGNDCAAMAAKAGRERKMEVPKQEAMKQ